MTKTEPLATLESIEDPVPAGILSKLKEHAAAAREHERKVEEKTDEALRFAELGIKRVEDLRHTAIVLAAALILAAIFLAKC